MIYERSSSYNVQQGISQTIEYECRTISSGYFEFKFPMTINRAVRFGRGYSFD